MRTMSKEQSKAKASAAKVRKNLSLETEVVTIGESLAKRENRNFSNLIETLILREEARQPEEAK